MGRNLELGLFQLSVHLIPYASSSLEKLQTESSWNEWVGDADRGGVAAGKEEHPRGQKKLMRATSYS